MTTLPQTTPIRMPRPGGSPTPVVTVQGHGSMPHAAPAPAGLTLADAWRVIRAHAVLIVVLLFVSAIGGFFLNGYLEKHHSKFTSRGHLQYQSVSNYDPVKNPNPSTDGTTLSLELSTQVQMLRHDALLTKLIIDPNSRVRRLAWFVQFPTAQEAKTALSKNLVVSPIPGTRLIEVAMVTPIAKDSQVIVEELGEMHIRSQKELAQNRQLDRTRLLVGRRKTLEDKLREQQKSINDKAALLTSRGFDPINGTNTNKNEEVALAGEQLRLGSEIVNLQNRLTTIIGKLNAGEIPTEFVAAVESDQKVTGFRNAIERINMELELLTTLGEEHPKYKRFIAEREAYSAKLEKLRSEHLASIRVTTMDSLQASIAALKQRYDIVSRQLEEAKEANKALVMVQREYLLARDDAATTKAEIVEITASLDHIKTINDIDNGGVSWSTRPTTPDSPSFPKMTNTMAMSIMAGLALALGIAFLRELTNNTVRSPRDISRIGQLNLLGMISDINDDAQSAGAKLPLAIFEAPHAMIAEQFRQVRTRMQHAASLDSTRSILVTSPGAGDGKSTVACNLAAGLALNGRRILLVDANFRRPELHKTFNLSNDTGFSDVLNQLDSLPANIRETQVPNLAVLTSGAKPINATELFESQLLVDFIEKALEEFDHVVFDSGPLLVVSETVALAPRVDGVVSVVRARYNSRGVLTRMRDTLKQLKAEHLGVILNGVRAQGGGYYGRNIKAYYAYGDNQTPQLTGPTSAA
jgi:succinoglycan biosynthesis transport protein ExoP